MGKDSMETKECVGRINLSVSRESLTDAEAYGYDIKTMVEDLVGYLKEQYPEYTFEGSID